MGPLVCASAWALECLDSECSSIGDVTTMRVASLDPFFMFPSPIYIVFRPRSYRNLICDWGETREGFLQGSFVREGFFFELSEDGVIESSLLIQG